MSDLPLRSAGDKLPRNVDTFNEWTKAARKSRTSDMTVQPVGNQPFSREDTIRVYNDTGTDIEWRYGIVGLKEPIFLPDASDNAERTFRDTPTFKIEYPCTDTYRGRFAVLQGPLPDGRIGYAAILSGKFVSLVDEDVTSGDEVDVSEDARQDDNSLSKVSGGVAKCLWAGPGTDLPEGTQWGIMRFGGGGGVTLRHARVKRVCNSECSIYEIEFVTRSFSESCGGGTESGTGSGS